MQPALRPASTLAAAIALTGAGLTAVHLPSGAQDHAVQLTSVDWETAGSAILANLDALGERISADPFPALTQWSENLAGYGHMVGGEFQSSLDGLQGIFTGYGPAVGLQELWPQVLEDLDNGDFFSAYAKLNTDFLFDLLNITQPFFNHVPHGTDDFIEGAAGIPAMMLHNLADVSAVFADYSLWKDLAEAALAPVIGVLFQTIEAGSTISSLFADGDTGGAFTELANMPAQIADALFNGYLPPEAGGADQFVGLLTEGGILDQLLVSIPQQVAEALGASAPESADPAAFVDLADIALGV